MVSIDVSNVVQAMDAVKEKKLVVVDICNTLYDSNTTFDFIKYCVASGKIRRGTFLYRISISKISPLFWLLRTLQKLTGQDYHKVIAVGLFKNKTVDEVERWAHLFYKEYLQKKTIEKTNRILKEVGGADVVLTSSTIEPVAKAIAESLGIADYIATEMEMDGGRYTGTIRSEVSGKKWEAIRKRFASENFVIDMVLTDNFTDKELMYHSIQKIAVCYNSRDESFWEKIPGVTILQVRKGDITSL